MSDRHPGWSSPGDVAARLRRRWSSGDLLSSYSRGLPFEPIAVPLRGPSPGEIAAELAPVRDWITGLERGSRRRGQPAYRLELKSVGGRLLGNNQLPVRAWVESYDAAWRLLDVEGEVARLVDLLALTRARRPQLADWVVDHPLRALALAEVWPQLLSTVAWMVGHRGLGVYLRQIDVPGVDTKFVEQHRIVLADLLDVLLEATARLDGGTAAVPRSDLARRYGFCAKPAYVRLRWAGGAFAGAAPAGLTEATVRVEELARLDPKVYRVVVLENEVTYLAFPALADSLVMFGGGYTVSAAGSLPWLAGKEVWYWGDLDTHGFAILDRLRRHCPSARSLLMDRATLLDHRDRWGTEPGPTRAHLDHLTHAESDLYRDLVEDVFGPSVRLEQERISWAAVESALAGISAEPPPVISASSAKISPC